MQRSGGAAACLSCRSTRNRADTQSPPPARRRPPAATLSRVRIRVSDQHVEIRLAPWQKALGLLKTSTVARSDISDVRVVAEPLAEVA